MYFPDYQPTEEELANKAKAQALIEAASEKNDEARKLWQAIEVLQKLYGVAVEDALKADKQYVDFVKANGMDGINYE